MSKQYGFYHNGENFVKIIQRILGSEFVQSEKDEGVEFYHTSGPRILMLVDADEQFRVVFDVPIPDIHRLTHTIRHISDDRDGVHSHWIYEGTSIEDVITLTEIALENFRKHAQ